MKKVPEIPTEHKSITVPKNTREDLRLSLAEFNGHPYADLRIYYRADDSGEMRPSKKGITISPDRWPFFMEGLQRLEEEMERRGLLEQEGAEG